MSRFFTRPNPKREKTTAPTSDQNMMQPSRVWLVMGESENGSQVMGAFHTQDDAADYAEEIKHLFDDGAIYFAVRVPFKRTEGSGYAEYEPGDTK